MVCGEAQPKCIDLSIYVCVHKDTIAPSKAERAPEKVPPDMLQETRLWLGFVAKLDINTYIYACVCVCARGHRVAAWTHPPST